MWQGQGRFGAFGEGKGLFGTCEMRDDVMDRVRYWAEECDAFQVRTPTLTHVYLQIPKFFGKFASGKEVSAEVSLLKQRS